MSRLTCHAFAALATGVLVSTAFFTASAPASGVRVADGLVAEIVATGLVRPIQMAFDGDERFVVLSHGAVGDAAGEIVWIDVRHVLPVDASTLPRVVIPFAEGRQVVYGSVTVDPRGGDLYLGEENGNRVYHLTRDQRLRPAAVGVQHLVGGGGIALDGRGRLVVLDFVSQLDDEGYHGPLVFRVNVDASGPLPRRLDLVPPLFPRGWPRQSGETLARFVSVTPLAGDELAILTSMGEIFVIDPAGALRRLARLPAGHYHRTNMAVAPDGSIFVSSGFQVRKIYRITPGGGVSVVASDLGDPGGVAVDGQGRLYVVETALHRVIRIRRME